MLTVHCQVGKLATEPGLDRTTALVLSQQCGTLMTVGAPLAVRCTVKTVGAVLLDPAVAPT